MKVSRFLMRILVYLVGIFLVALGVSISINSNLGVTAVTSLPYVISLITNIRLSYVVIATYTLYVILQIVILRKKYRWYNIFQLAFSTAFGFCIDLTNLIIKDWAIPTYFGKLGMVAMSVLLVAGGIALIVDTRLVPMPVEGLALTVSQVTNVKFGYCKLIIDSILVLTATILSLVFLHKLEGVREGTFVLALTVGLVVRLIQPFIKPLVDKICFPDEKIPITTQE